MYSGRSVNAPATKQARLVILLEAYMTLPRRPTTLDGTIHSHRITCAACLSLLGQEAWMAAPAAKAGRAAARSSPIPPPSFLPSCSTNVNGNLPSRLPVLRAVRLPARAQGRTGARRRALFWVAAYGLAGSRSLPVQGTTSAHHLDP